MNPKIRHRIQNSPPPVSILGNIDQIQAFPIALLEDPF
jgi:hypothetical protein